MIMDNCPLTELVLDVVSKRLLLQRASAAEQFQTIAAAQPAADKRRRLSDDQLAEFVNDLNAELPDLAEDIAVASQHDDRPSVAM